MKRPSPKAKGKSPTTTRALKPKVRPSPTPDRGGPGCLIVGVGASAGGLEAFTQLLQELPVDTGLGFVLVQHLDPEHDSALTQILARATAMPVLEVTDHLRVEANHVYIIPPNTSLGIEHGVLKLQPRVRTRTPAHSIDAFFESLARDQRERAIGVILSGSATDGTLGLEAIKAEGGITLAQDNSARYESMPRSAVSAGCVDFVLSPEKIAHELARIARHPFVADRPPEAEPSAPMAQVPKRGPSAAARAQGRAPPEPPKSPAEPGYDQILLLLRQHSGVDFSLYKSTTVHRRIMRRMVLNRQDSLAHYATFLRGNTAELDALYGDALINVTSFFRNAEAFDVLRRKVFAPLLEQGGEDPLRVWVLGCSTGQEAYSIAMVYAELAEKMPHPRRLQVFATDLNESNLEKARHGFYAPPLVRDVSPERVSRFFVKEDGGYRVVKALRESVVFARQNLISDPPFSRMDLITCRNVMIYLEPEVQNKALLSFHYALKPGGFLFLGASESIGSLTNLFAPVDKRQKIFSRKAAPHRALQLPAKSAAGRSPELAKTARPTPMRGLNPPPTPETLRTPLDPQREADRVTIDQFAPPGVLINADLQILQFRGATGAYLEPATGKASFDLLKMARKGLMLPLRAAINQAKAENKPVRVENVPFGRNGQTRRVQVEVVPLRNLTERCFLVLFKEVKEAENRGPARRPATAGGDPRPDLETEAAARCAELDRDLAETRDYLQSVLEQQEVANSELQSANEEGQSANEELQSLNEELETSKEELESTNEELTTVNDEVVHRNNELHRLNNDLVNLQAAAQLGIVLLGGDLTIRRFSPQAERQFNLRAADIGRPLPSVRHNLQCPELESMITEVIAQGLEAVREVQDNSGHWYSLRVRPYVTLEKKVDGAVVVLVDIDELKRRERLIREEHEHAEAIIHTVPNPLVILGTDLRVVSANESFYSAFKVPAEGATGLSIFELDRGAWDFPRLRHLLEEIVPRNSVFNDFEVTHNFTRIGRRHLLLNARVLNHTGGKAKEILLGIHDVTDHRIADDAMRESEERYRTLFNSIDEGFCIIEMLFDAKGRASDYVFLEANPAFDRQSGIASVVGKRMRDIAPHHEKHWFDTFGEIALSGVSKRFQSEAKSLDRWFDVYGFRLGGSESRKVAVIFTDITARRKAREALYAAQAQLSNRARHLELAVIARTAELTTSNEQLKSAVRESHEIQQRLRKLTHQFITAQEEQRREISRELHDQVVQTLVGINVELSALGQDVSASRSVLKARVVRTQRLVENAVNVVHRFARELRPAMLDDLGLIPALHAFCTSLAERKKFRIHLTVFAGVEALGNPEQTALFRVAQEALANVDRHAKATHAKLTIAEIPGAVRMEISDNGRSFDVARVFGRANPSRLGLVGMRERMEMVGGTLTVQSIPGTGTTVRAEIPIKKVEPKL